MPSTWTPPSTSPKLGEAADSSISLRRYGCPLADLVLSSFARFDEMTSIHVCVAVIPEAEMLSDSNIPITTCSRWRS